MDQQPKETPPAYSPGPRGYGHQPGPIGFEASAQPTNQFVGAGTPLLQPSAQYGSAYPGPPPTQYPVTYVSPGQTVVTVPAIEITRIVIANGCPSCQVGTLLDHFTCSGICLAIFFFPVGLLCLFLLRERRCTNCGTSF